MSTKTSNWIIEDGISGAVESTECDLKTAIAETVAMACGSSIGRPYRLYTSDLPVKLVASATKGCPVWIAPEYR